MPVFPNIIERQILRLNTVPTPLFDTLGAGALRAVDVAVKLGIFETLGNDQLSPAELAKRANAEERGINILLEALEAFGYVKKRDKLYSNTRMTAKWLLSSSPTNFSDWAVPLQRLQLEFWDEYLEDAIRLGKPPLTIYEWFDKQPERWKVAQAGFQCLAPVLAKVIVDKVQLPPRARRLVDVGGGHGLYSVEFCRKYPELSAVVFDAPGALKTARETIAQEKMGDRVSMQLGNFWKDELGSGFDVALLFNVIHGYAADQNLQLIYKIAGALNPGGVIIIQDLFRGPTLGPATKALYRFWALSFFATMGGQLYTYKDVAPWLEKAGFTPRQVRTRSFFLPYLITGTRKA